METFILFHISLRETLFDFIVYAFNYRKMTNIYNLTYLYLFRYLKHKNLALYWNWGDPRVTCIKRNRKFHILFIYWDEENTELFFLLDDQKSSFFYIKKTNKGFLSIFLLRVWNLWKMLDFCSASFLNFKMTDLILF